MAYFLGNLLALIYIVGIACAGIYLLSQISNEPTKYSIMDLLNTHFI